MDIPTALHLDCRGLACPMPIVRISRAIKSLESGQRLHIEASDGAFAADLHAWLSTRPDRLISLVINGDSQSAVIQKVSKSA